MNFARAGASVFAGDLEVSRHLPESAGEEWALESARLDLIVTKVSNILLTDR